MKSRVDIIPTTLDLDEILTWQIISEPLLSTLSKVFSDTQMPLYYIVLNLFGLLFDGQMNDYWLRIPSVFFSIMTILTIFFYSTTRINPLTAFITIFPVIYWNLSFFSLSIYARPYSLLILLITINLLSLFQLINPSLDKNRGKRTTLIFNITLPLIALTHHLFTIYFATILFIILIQPNLKKLLFKNIIKTKAMLFHALWITLIYIPILAYQYLNYSSRLSWVPEKGISSLIGLINRNVLGNTFSWGSSSLISDYIFVSICIIGMLANLFFKRKLTRQHHQSIFLLSYILTISLFFMIVSISLQPLIVPRYFSILMPAIFLTGAMIIEEIITETSNSKKILMALFFIPITFPLIYPKVPSELGNYKIDIKQLIRRINKQSVLEDKVLCLFSKKDSNSISKKENIFTMYSQMYHQKNVCKKVLTIESSTPNDFREFNTIIYYGNKPVPNKWLKKYNILFSDNDRYNYTYLMFLEK
jgi:hypothetical protein